MADEHPSSGPLKTAQQTAKAAEAARKQARLSQALKANMARRKGQTRARNAQTGQAATHSSAQGAQDKDS